MTTFERRATVANGKVRLISQSQRSVSFPLPLFNYPTVGQVGIQMAVDGTGRINCQEIPYVKLSSLTRDFENNLHWVLDYAFDEDSNRARKGNSAANMAVVRHIALNLIKADTSSKIGIKNRRLKAGWDNDYLEKLLMGK